MSRTLPIPLELLPAPRLVIWHGDEDLDGLIVIRRTYQAVLNHGFVSGGTTAGGNDWTGWHLPDSEAVAGLAIVARAIAPDYWTIIEDRVSS